MKYIYYFTDICESIVSDNFQIKSTPQEIAGVLAGIT
jgi:hypothetical protein